MPGDAKDSKCLEYSGRRDRMRRFRLWAARHFPAVHPAMESLLSHADGRRDSSVEAHLARCAQCRQKTSLLCAAVKAARGQSQTDQYRTAQLLNETFGNLQIQMQAWTSLRGTASERPFARGVQVSQLSKALEFYFGREAARRLQQSGRWDPADIRLVPLSKPLFSTFLGRKAADALVHRIAAATT